MIAYTDKLSHVTAFRQFGMYLREIIYAFPDLACMFYDAEVKNDLQGIRVAISISDLVSPVPYRAATTKISS